MKTTNSSYGGKRLISGERNRALFVTALLGALLLSGPSIARAQAYGVRRTAVVHGPNRTVVASRTTVVAGGGGLPHGYIAALPGGYRAVVVSGARYYTVGGIYYRPQMYGGRTVYVRVHI
jgi:hypothetical protein